MKVLRKNFMVNGVNGEFWIDIYSDTHFGSKSIDETLLRRHVDETKEKNRLWVHLGDGIDGILPVDKRRFSEENTADWAWSALKEKRLIDAEWEYFEDSFKAIKKSCLFVLDGDGKHNVCDGVSDCMRNTLLKMNILGGFPATYCVFSFKRHPKSPSIAIHLVFHHGWFAGRTSSNKVINLERALNYYPKAWGFFCGHGHNKVSTRIDSLTVRGNKEVQMIRRAAMTGSYLRTYAQGTTNYAEVKGYPPSALGRISVCLRPFAIDEEKRIELYNM